MGKFLPNTRNIYILYKYTYLFSEPNEVRHIRLHIPNEIHLLKVFFLSLSILALSFSGFAWRAAKSTGKTLCKMRSSFIAFFSLLLLFLFCFFFLSFLYLLFVHILKIVETFHSSCCCCFFFIFSSNFSIRLRRLVKRCCSISLSLNVIFFSSQNLCSCPSLTHAICRVSLFTLENPHSGKS